MTNPAPDGPEALWQSQREEQPSMTLADIRRKAQTFQTKIRRRNIREYLFSGAGTIVFAAFIWILPGLITKIGCALTLLAIYFVVYQLHRDGSAREVPAEAAAGDCLAFHRRELERQRDLLRRVGPWQIGPMVPGLALFFAGLWVANVDDRGDVVAMTISGLLMAAVLAIVYWLNVRAANQLQREVDLLTE
jgi:hypothetical protein